MDIVTLGAALNGSAEYVNSHFRGGSNIQIVDNPDGTQTINASGEVSSEDTVARAEIAEMKDGVKILKEDGWVIIRPSGTEPIFRCFSESDSQTKADEMTEWGLGLIKKYKKEAYKAS